MDPKGISLFSGFTGSVMIKAERRMQDASDEKHGQPGKRWQLPLLASWYEGELSHLHSGSQKVFSGEVRHLTQGMVYRQTFHVLKRHNSLRISRIGCVTLLIYQYSCKRFSQVCKSP